MDQDMVKVFLKLDKTATHHDTILSIYKLISSLSLIDLYVLIDGTDITVKSRRGTRGH